MAYTPTVWTDTSPITKEALNKIETGLASASNDTVPITRGGTGAITAAAAKNNLGIFPVNALYSTVTNTNPNTLLGYGTWTVHKREIVDRVLPVNTGLILTKANVSSYTGYVFIANNVMRIQGYLTTAAVINTATVELAKLDMTQLGISSVAATLYGIGIVSNVALTQLQMTTDGTLSQTGIFPKTAGATLPSGSRIYIDLCGPIRSGHILDTGVQTWQWKRAS